jgi:hypothetical protein
MSRMTSEYPERVYSSSEERQPRRPLQREGARRPGLLLAGLAALGVGVLAWYYFAPDLRRYMKIRNM